MKYIIMCGGKYNNFTGLPKQFTKVNGTPIIERTVNLLKNNGVKIDNIIITSNNKIFDELGVQRLSDENNTFSQDSPFKNMQGFWVDGFYRLNEPTVYLFGDVYYSEDCIRKIINSTTQDILFFTTAKPFAKNNIKNHVEPLGFKVVDYNKFYEAIDKCKKLFLEGKFWRHPIAFDLWAVVKNFPTDYDYFKEGTADVFGTGCIAIYDYTTDIDNTFDAKKLEAALSGKNTVSKDQVIKPSPNIYFDKIWGRINSI